MRSPMQLKKIILHSLVIRSRRDPLTEVTKSDPSATADSEGKANLQYSLARHSEHPAFRLPVRIRIDWPPESGARFTEVQVDLEGIIEFPEDTPEDEIRRYIPVMGLANLYGVARTLIAQNTAMSQGGVLMLPNINMNDVVQQNKKWKEEKAVSVNEKAE